MTPQSNVLLGQSLKSVSEFDLFQTSTRTTVSANVLVVYLLSVAKEFIYVHVWSLCRTEKCLNFSRLFLFIYTSYNTLFLLSCEILDLIVCCEIAALVVLMF